MKQVKYREASTASAVLFFMLFVPSLYANEGEERIERGIDQFGKGDYRTALTTFRDVILDNSLEEYHGTAYFWISRSYMAMEDFEKAQQNLEFYLSEYGGHRLYPDALYQKGRLLHRQKEYQKSIRQLYRYIEEYPSHPYKANAYFWVGESLYALGHYDKAESIFSLVVRDYPKSFKIEAARYRLSLIDLKRREEVLLKLLKMSHEEYLKAIEKFDRKEKSYEQAITGYQRKLAAATADNDNELIDALNEELEHANRQIKRLEDQASSLRRQVEEGGKTPAAPVSDKEKTMDLLELKRRALTLKEFYIKQLSEQRGGQ